MESEDLAHWTPPSALKGIRTFNHPKPREDQWLDAPYFNHVRNFLRREKFKQYSSRWMVNFWTNRQGKQGTNIQLEIEVSSESISILRILPGSWEKGIFRDALPYKAIVKYENFPTFTQAYNRLIEYAEKVWNYNIIGHCDRQKGFVFPGCFKEAKKPIPENAIVELLLEGEKQIPEHEKETHVFPISLDSRRLPYGALDPKNQLYTDYARVYYKNDSGDLVMIAHYDDQKRFQKMTQEDRDFAQRRRIETRDLESEEIPNYYGRY